MTGPREVVVYLAEVDPDTGRQKVETWTSDGDGLTEVSVHPSGALQLWCGVNRPPALTISFGGWTRYTCT